MECQEVKELMSDYLEQYLTESEAARVAEHIAGCGECHSELDDLEETLHIVHGLPQQEPVFDLWNEIAPKCVEIQAQMQLSLPDRVRMYFVQLFLALSEGWEIFITTVCYHMSGKARTVGE